jgi:hypothetical protein
MQPSGASDVHVIELPGLAPGEWFTLEFLSLGEQPAPFQYIRSKDGYAQHAQVALQWAVPTWVARINFLIYYVGLGFSAYWVVKAANLVWGALTAVKK